MSTSRFRIIGLRILIVIIPTLVICLIILEFGLRVTGREPSNTTDGFFEQHGSSYRLKKNFSKTKRTPSHTFILNTNSYGFRDAKAGPREIGQRPYMVFLGDSMTFANGVNYEESFVGIVSESLAEDGMDVANLAVGGHFLKEQLEVLRDFMGQVDRSPAIVAICFTPPLIQGFDRSYSNILVKRGYLFRKDRWFLPFVRMMLGNISASYCFFRDNIRRIQATMTSDGALDAHNRLAVFAKDHPFYAPPVLQRLQETLREIDQLILRMGARPLYVYLPASPDLKLPSYLRTSQEPQESYDFQILARLLRTHCEADHIPFFDLYPTLKELEDSGKSLSFVLDAHYNASANLVIGETLYQALTRSGELTSAQKGKER